MHQLEKLRKERGWSAPELARQALICDDTINRVERCARRGQRTRVNVGTASALAQALGVDSLDIFRPGEITDEGREIRTGGSYTQDRPRCFRICADCGDVAATAVSACENCDSPNLIARIA